MKKKYIIFITSYFFVSNYIFATQPVTDPGSYGYYVEQIDHMKKQVEILNENMKNIREVSDTITQVRTMISEAYNNTFGIIGSLNRLVNEIKKLPDSAKVALEKFKSEADCLFEDLEGYQKIENMLDTIYNDPEYAKKYPCSYSPTGLRRKLEFTKEQKKRALIEGIAVRDQLDQNLEKIVEMAEKSMKTKNVKDSQDLTNGILLQILETNRMILNTFNNFQLAILAPMYKSDSIEKKEGEKDNLYEEYKKRAREHLKAGKDPDILKVKIREDIKNYKNKWE